MNVNDGMTRTVTPWATVRLSVEFPGDVDTYASSVLLYGTESLEDGIQEAKSIMIDCLARDAGKTRKAREALR